jgi:RNA-binding protein
MSAIYKIAYFKQKNLMSLDKKTKQEFMVKAHKLKPVVMIGIKGLTENTHIEIERALHDHELIKIRIQNSDRELKKQMFADICASAQAEAVHFIGGIGVLYRKRVE